MRRQEVSKPSSPSDLEIAFPNEGRMAWNVCGIVSRGDIPLRLFINVYSNHREFGCILIPSMI